MCHYWILTRHLHRYSNYSSYIQSFHLMKLLTMSICKCKCQCPYLVFASVLHRFRSISKPHNCNIMTTNQDPNLIIHSLFIFSCRPKVIYTHTKKTINCVTFDEIICHFPIILLTIYYII
jgi:hypothetical protein